MLEWGSWRISTFDIIAKMFKHTKDYKLKIYLYVLKALKHTQESLNTKFMTVINPGVAKERGTWLGRGTEWASNVFRMFHFSSWMTGT